MPQRRSQRVIAAFGLAAMLAIPSRAAAYSVFAHEAMIDAAWQANLEPAIKKRYPRATNAELRNARAYAYGGSLIQDLGYYPFGSKLFSNLVHYVRSGDFVAAMIREARTVNEFAFALGALAHYTSDVVGHPAAVNRSVPLVYPKLRAKYGDRVLYVQSPARHLMVEFAFDVNQVARGAFTSDQYQNLIGFEVALPVLERAFRETYGLELRDLFGDTDLAIGTYRHMISTVIPDMTRLAWRDKRDEILAATPNLTERDVVYTLTRQQYESKYGTAYRKPGLFARIVVMVFKVLPKFGPFKPLAFEPLTAESARLFGESFATATARYRAAVSAVAAGRVTLRDLDLDTGHPPARGTNALADETYADLLDTLEDRGFAGVPTALTRDITTHYASAATTSRQTDRKTRKQEREAARQLAALNASADR